MYPYTALKLCRRACVVCALLYSCRKRAAAERGAGAGGGGKTIRKILLIVNYNTVLVILIAVEIVCDM